MLAVMVELLMQCLSAFEALTSGFVLQPKRSSTPVPCRTALHSMYHGETKLPCILAQEWF